MRRAHLVSEHEGNNLQHMQTPLLLGRGAGQEEEQVIHAAEMDGPEKPVMDAGIVIDPLSRWRGRKDTLSCMTAPKVPNAEDRKTEVESSP